MINDCNQVFLPKMRSFDSDRARDRGRKEEKCALICSHIVQSLCLIVFMCICIWTFEIVISQLGLLCFFCAQPNLLFDQTAMSRRSVPFLILWMKFHLSVPFMDLLLHFYESLAEIFFVLIVALCWYLPRLVQILGIQCPSDSFLIVFLYIFFPPFHSYNCIVFVCVFVLLCIVLHCNCICLK